MGREVFFLTTGTVSKDSAPMAGGGGAGDVKLGDFERATPMVVSVTEGDDSVTLGNPNTPAVLFSKLNRNP
jgi:hypothetical protein